jgi:hypothetical protein
MAESDVVHIEAVIREVIAEVQERCAVVVDFASLVWNEGDPRVRIAARIRALDLAGARVEAPKPAPSSDAYPCADCGKPRTKAQGGATFTVCDECWDKHYPGNAKYAPAPQAAGMRPAEQVADEMLADKWKLREGEHDVFREVACDAIEADRATRPPAVPVDLDIMRTLDAVSKELRRLYRPDAERQVYSVWLADIARLQNAVTVAQAAKPGEGGR